MTLDPPKFRPHGASDFEVRGQILVLRSQGPFNEEHIQSLAPAFRQLGAALQKNGPWATINMVERSILATPEAIAMLRRSIRWTHDELGRIAAAYVADHQVEGSMIMLPELRQSCLDIMPMELFEDFRSAEIWALTQISNASAG